MRFCLPANAFYLLAWYSKLPLANPQNRAICISKTKTPIQVSGSEFFIIWAYFWVNLHQKGVSKNERNYSMRLLAGIAVFTGTQR